MFLGTEIGTELGNWDVDSGNHAGVPHILVTPAGCILLFEAPPSLVYFSLSLSLTRSLAPSPQFILDPI